MFKIRENLYVPGLMELTIGSGSKIDIRDDGQLRVPFSMQTTIDSFISSNQIVAGSGGTLNAFYEGNEYVVTTSQPLEPGPGGTSEIPFVRSYFNPVFPSIPVTSEAYNELAAMGVNVVQDSSQGISLPIAKAAGMELMVDFHHNGVRNEITYSAAEIDLIAQNFANQYSSHPELLGYNLRDEPNASEFATLALVQQKLLQYMILTVFQWSISFPTMPLRPI